ncbi:MAG TPA: DUF5719 family protein [Acidimicrobiales bacterium]|nr:DUF5719 family protein [Acidimicrobiales bacterium]
MSRHAARSARRAPILAVLIAVLVAGGLLDRGSRPAAPVPAGAPAVQPMPIAAPAAALSSSWFCAGASDGGSPSLPGTVVIANGGARPVSASVTVVGASSKPTTTTVPVAAYRSATVAEKLGGGGQWVGAIVTVDGGSVGVSQVTDGPLGRTTTPCATSGSQHWYFPAGQTRVNADEAIILLNPYPTDSIVDLSFTTDQGIEQPQDFQGLDVPRGGLVAVDIGSRLRRRASIATTVSARSGSVVAYQVGWVTPPPANAPLVGTKAASAPLADPALPSPGDTVTLGAPSAGTSWVWPDGWAGNGLDERYVIYNPGPRPADVKLSVGLQQGSAEPFSVKVEPYSVVPVVSEQSARIPAGVAHSATLTSENGVPVVAARTVTAVNASGPVGVHSGVGQLLGGRLTAPDWLIPAPMTDASHHGHVVIYNPGTATVTAQLSGPGISGSQAVTVPAAGRADVQLGPGVSGPLGVRATRPVYTEYDLYGPAGLSLSFGIPLS